MDFYLKNVRFDPHTHGPWEYWNPVVQGEKLKKTRQKIVDTISKPRNLDSLLEVYIPKLSEGNIAIVLGNLTLDRYAGLLNELSSPEEQDAKKKKYSLQFIDTRHKEYFTGFKSSNGANFYMIRGQEPHLSDGHIVAFPLNRVIDYKNEQGSISILDYLKNIENEEISPIILATHPCMKLSRLEKLGLHFISELSGENLSMSEITLRKLCQKGVIDSIESYNSSAGRKHNLEIIDGVIPVIIDFGISTLYGSDAYSGKLSLNSFNTLDMDFSDPSIFARHLRKILRERDYSSYKCNEAKFGIPLETLKMILVTFLMQDKKRDYE